MADEEKKPEQGTPPPAPPAAKPAAPPAAHAAPKPPPAMASQPWEDEMVARMKERFGAAIKEAATYLGQNFFVVDAASIEETCESLRDDEEFDYLVDLTAVDYPKKEKRFEIIYQLYSFARNVRLRVKAAVGENEPIASVTPVWSTANWLEREAYDMFGVRFSGHPDLKRILLPDDWQGFPLRKDHGIIQQDTQWVQENLHIESGQ